LDSLADELFHPFGDCLRRAQRFAVPDSHDLVALAPKPRVTLGVANLCHFAVVPRTVDLDHQPGAVMREVRDVSADRRLPADVQLQLSQFIPEPLLRERHLAAEPLRPSDRAGRVTIVVEARRQFRACSSFRRLGLARAGVSAEGALPAAPSFHPIRSLPH
jgi:hypothetical protein